MSDEKMFDKSKIHEMLKSRKSGSRVMGDPDARAAEGEVHSMDAGMDGKHMAAQDMIDSFHAKDPAKLKTAMNAFMDLHHAEQGNLPDPEGKVTADKM